MTVLAVRLDEAVEGRVVRYAEHPIPFDLFLEMADGEDLELVDGVMVEKAVVQLTHEKLYSWLYHVVGLYVKKRGLGIVLGSRTAVKISEFGGRLPDIVFVPGERMEIVQEKAIVGAPDLVIELVSPNDRPSDIIALETDYRSAGVAEIVFIDQQKRRVRVLRRREAGYEEAEPKAGLLSLETIEGLQLEIEWLFQDPRPDELDTLTLLLSAAKDRPRS